MAIHWSTQQLVELLAAVSSFHDEGSAARGGLERIVEAIEAEAAALVERGRVVSCLGFPAGDAPEDALVALAEGRSDKLALPGASDVQTLAAPLADVPDAWIVVARAGAEGFKREEISLLRGMARVLALTLVMLRTLAAERERAAENDRLVASLRDRQRLLEKSAEIQRAITHRAPLEDVLQAIADSAGELIGDEVAGLRLVDDEDPTLMHTVASVGVAPARERRIKDGRVGDRAGGRAIAENRLVVVERYDAAPGSLPAFAADGLQAAMAAPVHEGGIPVGTLVVASYEPGRRYSELEQETLLAFAEHASIALMDAKLVEAIRHQALHDALTGLPNRTLFLDRLRHSFERSERTGSCVAVLFVDIDRFKDVNDTLGHDAGDRLLVAFADRLRDSLRAADTAARLGGDEFAILIEDLDDELDAVRLAQRITEALDEPFSLDGRDLRVRASISIAGTRTGGDLLRDADLAMYRAKAAGGGFESFEPGMRTAVLKRVGLEADLRRAVAAGTEFVLHYQPIVELVSGRVHAVEARVRWSHPERGLVPPADFIGLAEDAGLIGELGRWILREACGQAAVWQRRYEAANPLVVAVNLSGRQLDDPGLVVDVAEALAPPS